MSYLCSFFFGVPPEPKRPIATPAVRFWIYYGYRQDDVDSYLFYKVWLFALVLNCISILVLISQYIGHFDIPLIFIQLSYVESSPQKAIQFLYPIIVLPTIIVASLSYAVLLFRKRSSLLHFVRKQSTTNSAAEPNSEERWHHHLWIGLVCTVAIMSMWAFPLFISSYHDSSPLFPDFSQPTLGKLLILAAFYGAAFQAGISAVIHAYIYAIHLAMNKSI